MKFKKLFFALYVLAIGLLMNSECLDRDTEYMESSCGNNVTVVTSFQLESSTGLTYLNLLDCTYTVTAPSGYFVIAIVTRFELEAALSGVCTDYLDVHDGSDTTTIKLNSNLVCGSGSSVPTNFMSSGRSMTLRFVTDNSGVYIGFGINLVSATNEPCSSSQFACNTSICIDDSLQCDNYDQCGDKSDEDDCTDADGGDSVNIVMAVVVTLIVVAVVAMIVAYVAWKIHARNQWRKFLHMHVDDDDVVKQAPSYPITHLYYKGLKGNPGFYDSNTKTDSEAGQINSTKNKKDDAEEIKPPGASVVA